MPETTIYTTTVDSPVGPLLLAGTENALHLISFPTGKRARKRQPEWKEAREPFAQAIAELDAYFAGDLKKFSISYELIGTPFQKAVWQALADIPYGQTVSYGDLAQAINRPKAFRAVGAANGANNLPILLPCHRVVGANKALTGFGGGLETKAFLLQHESNHQFALAG